MAQLSCQLVASDYDPDLDVRRRADLPWLQPADLSCPDVSSPSECPFSQFTTNAKSDRSCAISGGSAQRSQAMSSTGFRAVSLRASLSHPSGRGVSHRHLPLVTFPVTQKALSLPGKGLDLRKLVAGEGFEPSTSGL